MDYCYGPDTTTRSLHDRTVEPLLRKLVEGYNTAVIVFGGTGESFCEPGQVVLCVIISSQILSIRAIQDCHFLCIMRAHADAAGTGKTSLLEGRKGIAIDDDSTNSTSQEGLARLIGTSLFDLLEEKQLSTGGHPACNQARSLTHHAASLPCAQAA